MFIKCKRAIGRMIQLLVIIAIPSMAEAGNTVVQPNTVMYGNTWGEWSVRWVQWFTSIPAATNPYFDTTGANCAVGQSGPVFFLAGAPANTVVRNCTVPRGKAIFFPVLNGMFGSAFFDCQPTVPGTPCILSTIRAAAFGSMDLGGFDTISAEIDKKPVKNIRDFRVSSPDFSTTLPDSNVISQIAGTNVAAGIYYPNVADGYYVFLNPMKPGNHKIHFYVNVNGGYFAGANWDVTYNLTVAP